MNHGWAEACLLAKADDAARDIGAVVDWIRDRSGQPSVALIPGATHYLFNDRPERGRDRFIQDVLMFLQG